MKTIDTNTFVNSFKVKPDKSMSFLLGAGASISSNIPSGGQMVWDFKRTLYCTANNIRTSLYGDLSKENVQKEIQSYFDGQGGGGIRNYGQQKNIQFILKSAIHQEKIESIIFKIKYEI